MHVRIPRPWAIRESEVTEERIYRARRHFMKTSAVAALGAGLFPGLVAARAEQQLDALRPLEKSRFSTDEDPNTYEEITSYNNFYEYGTGKEDPARLAPKYLKPEPWSVEITGEAEVTGSFALEDLLKPHALEERIYRLRCVEAWSMVIPWVGIPLADVIKRFKPTSRAKYVKLTTLLDPEQMPKQDSGGIFGFLSTIDWPYTEGLRMDEAMNELSLLAVGLYGKEMPAQNGAPIRLVVPWKYGFKSVKSIVSIHFQETQPNTTWNDLAPNEYGFYANVNPEVDHPRWSQARERRIGELFKRDTLMFNGYGEQVASLYRGMDLSKHY
ncbi:protein-methionine-sulfoxide reductase catalytic subunit MsrP [Ectothiorhodospiraceae bacterium WFHF3C12]|nr:protein-methionine-sulfoxide reductase catalytic subunit MsrP [Ectothiorhodospiraceae bacterium WFHF3C12]